MSLPSSDTSLLTPLRALDLSERLFSFTDSVADPADLAGPQGSPKFLHPHPSPALPQDLKLQNPQASHTSFWVPFRNCTVVCCYLLVI